VIIALDFGARYVGIAATDSDEKIAVRHSIIDQKQQALLPALQEVITHEKPRLVLVGLPISLSGNETEQTRTTRAFMEQLRAVVSPEIAIEPVDETLTSVEAERHVAFEGGDKALAHAEAARIILEDYLKR
jgi:putative Holliday junction resolvase